MGFGTRFAGGVAAALLAASAAAAPGAPSGGLSPVVDMLAVQGEPALPPAATIPPLLPAPSLPDSDAVAATERPAPVVPAPVGGIFSFADVAEQLVDSVVYISTAHQVAPSRRNTPSRPESSPGGEFFDDFFDDYGSDIDPRLVQSLGSGFVIDPSGLIVTNNHVIADADEIIANFADGRQLTATVLGVDEKTDLALLKVDAAEPLASARFGNSDALRVGDWVIAIGNPFGFGGSVTVGIVSALDRDINTGPYDRYIQTDAAINRGNSGGPLFNVSGEVVGINTAIMSPTGGSIGIGFAVPAAIAVPVIDQLGEHGTVRRGWIGVRIQDVTEDLAPGAVRARGAMIAGLFDGGPAANAGILAGDIVVAFNGREVTSMRDLPRIVADTIPGSTVEIGVLRGGERTTMSIEVGLLQDETQVAAAIPGDLPGTPDGEALPSVDNVAAMFGLSLGAITEEARQTYAIGPEVKGVLVTAVEPGSAAANISLQPGEIIVQVAHEDVDDPADVDARIGELIAEGRRMVLLLVSDADNATRYVSLSLDSGP
jgi:serine protease Do